MDLSNSRLDLSNSPFYLLRAAGDECVADARLGSKTEHERITCSLSPGHRRGGRRLSELDIEVRCDPPPDVIFTWLSECVALDRVFAIARQEGLSGLSAAPARVAIAGMGERLSGQEVLVTGWGGMANPSSGIREDVRCPVCGHLHYSGLRQDGPFFDLTSWDGSDFFIVWPLPRFRFVTERVVAAFLRHNVTGVRFVREWDLSTEGFTPGRLSYYMPYERAHELGDPYGIA